MMKVCMAGAAVLALATLSGCGTTGAASTETAYDGNVDKAQVAALESVARQRGVRIYWMQYPTKPASKIDTGSKQ